LYQVHAYNRDRQALGLDNGGGFSQSRRTATTQVQPSRFAGCGKDRSEKIERIESQFAFITIRAGQLSLPVHLAIGYHPRLFEVVIVQKLDVVLVHVPAPPV
jgi:hypothetical protein